MNIGSLKPHQVSDIALKWSKDYVKFYLILGYPNLHLHFIFFLREVQKIGKSHVIRIIHKSFMRKGGNPLKPRVFDFWSVPTCERITNLFQRIINEVLS